MYLGKNEKLFETYPEFNIEDILKRKKIQLIMKRLFDFTVSLLGIASLIPLFLVISILIKFDSKGSIFFKQERVGKEGKPFFILKFRTMVVDAESMGMQITVDGDKRITNVGHFLRKSKLDELPQLINVLLGDMSFVGPRPEVPKYVAKYNCNQRNILKVRPGITDNASIEFRQENQILAKSCNPEKMYIEEIMPRKLELNMKYINNMSIMQDIYIIFKTLFYTIKE